MEKDNVVPAGIFGQFFNYYFQKYFLKETALTGVVCVGKTEKT